MFSCVNLCKKNTHVNKKTKNVFSHALDREKKTLLLLLLLLIHVFLHVNRRKA